MIIDDERRFGSSKYFKLLIFLTGLIIAFILSRNFLIMPYIVSDESMNPGLEKGDYAIILKVAKPGQDDIILFKSPVEQEKVILKRIIAEGMNTIKIKNKRIYVNESEYMPDGNRISDKRIFPAGFSSRDNMSAIELKKNEVFVIGDNFDSSFDSRQFGPVNRELIIGELIFKL